MKVYVVICTSVYDDDYEGRESTTVERVFSSREKARDYMKASSDEMLRSLKTRCDVDSCVDCEEEMREYCEISVYSDDPDHIRVYEMRDYFYDYAVLETELDA